MQHRILGPLAFLSLLAACRAVPELDLPALSALPGLASGFPPQVRGPTVIAEATVYADAEEHVGADLAREMNALPVALRVGLRTEHADAAAVVLAEDEISLRLYLPDGTALERLPWTEIRRREPKLAEQAALAALRGDVLVPSWDEARELFAFFALPRKIDVAGPRALVRRRGRVQELALDGSLVAFDVRTESGRERVHVGVAYDLR